MSTEEVAFIGFFAGMFTMFVLRWFWDYIRGYTPD